MKRMAPKRLTRGFENDAKGRAWKLNYSKQMSGVTDLVRFMYGKHLHIRYPREWLFGSLREQGSGKGKRFGYVVLSARTVMKYTFLPGPSSR